MKIDPANFALELIETDVVESFETCTSDGADSMIGHKEVFFPAHKDALLLRSIGDQHWALSRVFLIRPERAELGPVTEVHLGICPPIVMVRREAILRANNLTLEVRCESRVVLGQACPRR